MTALDKIISRLERYERTGDVITTEQLKRIRMEYEAELQAVEADVRKLARKARLALLDNDRKLVRNFLTHLERTGKGDTNVILQNSTEHHSGFSHVRSGPDPR